MKLRHFFIAILAILFAMPLSAGHNVQTVYLKVTDSNLLFESDNFFAYFWSESNGADAGNLKMNKLSDGLYSVDVVFGFNYIKFLRLSPDATQLDWNEVWNQTDDLQLSNLYNPQYTITALSSGKYIGTWSVYGESSGEQSETRTIYLNSKEWRWMEDQGTYTYYIYAGSSETNLMGLQMTKVYDYIYIANIDKDYTKVVFACLPSGKSLLENAQERTEVLTLSSENNIYTINIPETSCNTYAIGSWSVYDDSKYAQYYGYGSCGTNLNYTAGRNGELTIIGSGEMSGYTSYNDACAGWAPWNTWDSFMDTIILPEGLTKIGTYAFEGCRIKDITIPSTMSTIGSGALLGIDLASITCKAVTPPSIDVVKKYKTEEPYHFCLGVDFSIPLYVPKGSEKAYKQADQWKDFIHIRAIGEEVDYVTEYSLEVKANNDAYGTVTGSGTYKEGTEVTLIATPATNYDFVKWNDGKTDNPRFVTVLSDSVFIAEFKNKASDLYFGEPETPQTVDCTIKTYSFDTQNSDNGILTAYFETADGAKIYLVYNTGSTDVKYIEGNSYSVTANSPQSFLAGYYSDGKPVNSYMDVNGTYYYITSGTITAVNYSVGTELTVDVTSYYGTKIQFMSFTSFYDPYHNTQYTITAKANNDAWGTVTGGGTYKEGTEVTLTAIPTTNYDFVKWNDGKTDNPRFVTVLSDSVFIAEFAPKDDDGGDNPGGNTAITVAEAIEATNALADGATSDKEVTIEGYVVDAEDFDWSSKNQVFYLSDTKNNSGQQVFYAYRCKAIENGEAVPVLDGDKVRLTGKLQKYIYGNKIIPEINNGTATFVSKVDGDRSEHPVEQISVSKALELASLLAKYETGATIYTIIGYVTHIAENNFNNGYQNMTFWMADTKGTAASNAEGAFYVYRAKPDVELVVGDKVSVTTKLKNFNGTLESETAMPVKRLNQDPVVNTLLPEAIDLGLPSGIRWSGMNVGAKTETEYGSFYQWGCTTPVTHQGWDIYCHGTKDALTKYCTDNIFGTADNKTVLDNADDAAAQTWGEGWRMPTKEEAEELWNNCTRTWHITPDCEGYIFTGPNGNSIFLPSQGWYDESGVAHSVDMDGFYWTSNLYEKNNNGAYALLTRQTTGNDGVLSGNENRHFARGIRGVLPKRSCRVTNTANVTITEGESFTYAGKTVTPAAGQYTYSAILAGANGCDSVLIWNVTVNKASVTMYTLSVKSNDARLGFVSGGGSYKSGETISVLAVPAAKCRFVKWNDGVTSNPRTVIITKDYTFTAIFAAVAGSAEEKIGEQQEYDEKKDAVDPWANTSKVIQNGHIYILRNGKMYTVQGQEVK